jgi:hypothetical protein
VTWCFGVEVERIRAHSRRRVAEGRARPFSTAKSAPASVCKRIDLAI